MSSHPVSTTSAIGSVERIAKRRAGDKPDGPRPICGGTNRNGTVCKRQPGWGTPSTFGHCSYHGGATPTGLKHSAQLEAEALSRRVMGTAIHMEPEDALQFCIDVTRGEIGYCDLRIGRLTDDDATVATSSERMHEELDRSGDVHELRDHMTESTALLHVWISTRQNCVDRLARYSKMALDAGVAERQVRLDERETEMIAGALLAVVAQLTLSDEDRARVPALLAEHVGGLDAPVIEGSAA